VPVRPIPTIASGGGRQCDRAKPFPITQLIKYVDSFVEVCEAKLIDVFF